MAILTKDEAEKILKKALSFSKAEECSLSLSGGRQGNIRYARNEVSTSGEADEIGLSITSSFGKKSGTATINELDDASLEKVVRRSEELARLAPENPEYVALLGPQSYEEAKTYFDNTAAINPDYRAKAAFDSIAACERKKLVAAGFMEDNTGFNAIMNSKGLFAYNRSTSVDFSLTARTEDGTGSGYVSRDCNDLSKLLVGKFSDIAATKAAQSVNAKALEPGKYTVILEPTAAIDLLSNMLGSMDGRSADEGRSFLSKKGGGTRVGEKFFDERVTIYSDPFHPEVPTSTWTNDGRKREKTIWVEKGIVKNVYNSRYWGQKNGIVAIPSPANAIIEGGKSSLEEMIRSTKKGILVTRLWYIRSVDPQTLLYTGLTRDGTFYIENGKIKYPVKNFRFNESPIIMLNNLEELGKPERINGSLVPPMKIRDFTFTSLSDAV